MRVGPDWLMNGPLFLVLAVSTLFAQGAIPQPLGVGGDKLYESTVEYIAQHPNCFLPRESLPANYKVSRNRDNLGEDSSDCEETSIRNDRLHLLGFRVRKKSTVISSDRVVAIFYDLRHKDFSAIENTLHHRLGRPTEEKIDGYTGHNGCKGKEIHWRNEVSDIVLTDECENDEYAVTLISLFYTRRPLTSLQKPPQ